MIEKIKGPLDLKVANYKGTEFDIIPADTFAMVCRKINELVDAVNEFGKDMVFLRRKVLELGYKDPQTRPENVQPEPETGPENVHAVCPAIKYMGKVCRFWNANNGKKFKNIGVLIEILSADNKRRYTCASKPKKHFEFCEPVKPDDDIIYKGE